jgi:hypothetical protein
MTRTLKEPRTEHARWPMCSFDWFKMTGWIVIASKLKNSTRPHPRIVWFENRSVQVGFLRRNLRKKQGGWTRRFRRKHTAQYKVRVFSSISRRVNW